MLFFLKSKKKKKLAQFDVDIFLTGKTHRFRITNQI